MFKVFAISILLLASISMSGELAHLCRPPQSQARGPKQFKLLIGTLLGLALFKH
jgi:hypothetical protein